jgi:hypothetical protein
MHCRFFAVSILLFVLAASAFSQAEHMSQPSPELKKLDYFVGNWKTEAQMKPGRFGPGGAVSSTERIEWQQGNFFLVGNVDYRSSMANGVELFVMGYDPVKKVFTYTSFNSSGERESATGTFDGYAWTWLSGAESPMKWKYVETVVSPNSYRIKFDMSQDGSTWATVMEGTAAKQ